MSVTIEAALLATIAAAEIAHVGFNARMLQRLSKVEVKVNQIWDPKNDRDGQSD